MDRRAEFAAWLARAEPTLPRSEPYPCPYLPDRAARQRGFHVGDARFDGELYHELMDRGYRRTGNVFYAMQCDGCRRCVPLRVPVATFRPTRGQRRTWRRNADVRAEVGPPVYRDESFALYRRYLRSQHPGSPQDDGEDGFRDFLYRDVVDSLEVRYRVDGRLIGVSLLDACSRSLSAVYHYFDPDERRRRVGVYSALWEIEHARALGVPHYYLGFWIEGVKTMQYKAEYGPHELLVDGAWRAAGSP